MARGVRQPGSAVAPALVAIRCEGCGAWHDDLRCPWCGRPHVGATAQAASDGAFRITVRYGFALTERYRLTAAETIDAFDALSAVVGGPGKPTKR